MYSRKHPRHDEQTGREGHVASPSGRPSTTTSLGRIERRHSVKHAATATTVTTAAVAAVAAVATCTRTRTRHDRACARE